MPPQRRKLFSAMLAVIGLAVVPAATANAASPGCSVRWVNAAGGDWATASNWSPARVPLYADNVCVSGTVPLTVNMSLSNADIWVTSLTVGGNATVAVHSIGPNLAPLHLPNGGTVGAHATLILSSDTTSPQGGVALATASNSSPLLINRGTIITQALPGSGSQGAVLASGVLNLGTLHVATSTTLLGTFVNRGAVVVDSGQAVFPIYPFNNIAFENETGGTISGAGLMDVAGTTFVENGGAVLGTPVQFETGTSTSETTLSLAGGGPARFAAHGRVARPHRGNDLVARLPSRPIDARWTPHGTSSAFTASVASSTNTSAQPDRGRSRINDDSHPSLERQLGVALDHLQNPGTRPKDEVDGACTPPRQPNQDRAPLRLGRAGWGGHCCITAARIYLPAEPSREPASRPICVQCSSARQRNSARKMRRPRRRARNAQAEPR